MSKETAKLFFEKMQTDETLQKQFRDLSNENNEVQAAKVIEVAAENGYKFSAEDITQLTKEKLNAMVESDELSEEELEAVAGGDIGKTMKAIQYSFLTGGVGCAASAIHNMIVEDDCRLAGWGKHG